MNKLLIILSSAFIFNAHAVEEMTFKIQCDEVQKFVDDFNEKVSSEKKLKLDYCNETFDTALFGIVKKNFQSTLSLSSEKGLCSNAEYVEKNITELGYGVNMGQDLSRVGKVLQFYGFNRGPTAYGGDLMGYRLLGVYYPVCTDL